MTKSIANLKAVGFDIDNTLYFQSFNELIPQYFCQEIAKKLGIKNEEVTGFYKANIKKYGNSPQTMRAFSNGRMPDKEIEDTFLDILEVHEKIEPQEDPLLKDFIKNLKEKYPLFVVTGNREGHALRKLRATGLDDLMFDEKFYAFERKESALRQASERLHVPFNNMMYMGDGEVADIIPATNLGMQTAKITQNPDPSTLANFQAKRVYELKNILL